jgi:hypothetical protein
VRHWTKQVSHHLLTPYCPLLSSISIMIAASGLLPLLVRLTLSGSPEACANATFALKALQQP